MEYLCTALELSTQILVPACYQRSYFMGKYYLASPTEVIDCRNNRKNTERGQRTIDGELNDKKR